MGSGWQDLRFGLRTLAKNPGFTAVAVLTLTLGIGATSAIFSVVNATLLAGLPYPEAERLVVVRGVKRDASTTRSWPISYQDFADWQQRNLVFAEVAVHTQARAFNLLRDGEVERVNAEMVSASYFKLLGQQPAAGRLFSAEEDRRGAGQRVVLLAHDFWQGRFGGDERLIGSNLVLNQESYEVIGVLPAGFKGLTDQAQIWLPVTLAATAYYPAYIEMRPFRWLDAVARLADGVTPEQAQAAMNSITAGLEQEHPDTNEGIGVELALLTEVWLGDLRRTLALLLAGAGLVLLIACTNIANLLLVRASGRQREIALRAALGAGRGRLMRQLLTESVLLALLGGTGGLLLGHFATGPLVALSSADFRSFVHPTTDRLVLGVIAGATLLCGIGFGLVPAWLSSQSQLQEVLKEGSKSSGDTRRHRFQSALVVTQVALALVLVVYAGAVIRSFEQLQRRDLGFQPEGLLTARVELRGPQYTGPGVAQQAVLRLLEAAQRVPEAAAVALAGPGIPTDSWYGWDFTLDQREDGPVTEVVQLPYHSVSPGYFTTLGVPLVAGRDFRPEERAGTPPVVIISERLAQRHWPHGDPLRQRLKFGDINSQAPWMEVVGVVGDVQHHGIRGEERPAPDLYFALLQIPPSTPPVVNFLLRPKSDSSPLALLPALREQLHEAAPDLPLYDARTMEQRLIKQIARDRFLTLLMSLFALLALGLAAVGIYGVIAYTVNQRRHEIGIRLALGADHGRVVRLVLGRALRLAAIGVATGIAASFLLQDAAAKVLPGLTQLDPVLLAGAALLLPLVALAASYLPARRATRIAPALTLREE